MQRKSSFAPLFFLAVLPCAALAAEPAPSPAGSPPGKEAPAAPAAKEQTPPLFEQLDTNHDGYVTKEEAKRSAEVTARFKELDSDQDGRIAAVEFKKGMQAKL